MSILRYYRNALCLISFIKEILIRKEEKCGEEDQRAVGRKPAEGDPGQVAEYRGGYPADG